jgi:hypothetical protein
LRERIRILGPCGCDFRFAVLQTCSPPFECAPCMTMCVCEEHFGKVSLTNFFVDKIFIGKLQPCRSLVQEAVSGLEIIKTMQIEFGSNSHQIELLKPTKCSGMMC